jgi:CheY-like chemotaxis protein
MDETTPRRKILIIEKEQAIRNVLFSLLAGLGCDRTSIDSGRDALSELSREPFDAVLLDLRSSDLPPEEVVSSIHLLRPSLIGHVLVITGEVADPAALELIERHFLLQVPRDRLLPDLLGCLRALLRIAPTPHQA